MGGSKIQDTDNKLFMDRFPIGNWIFFFLRNVIRKFHLVLDKFLTCTKPKFLLAIDIYLTCTNLLLTKDKYLTCTKLKFLLAIDIYLTCTKTKFLLAVDRYLTCTKPIIPTSTGQTSYLYTFLMLSRAPASMSWARSLKLPTGGRPQYILHFV